MDFLDRSESSLDPDSLKIRRAYSAELGHAARTGTLPMQLYNFLKTLGILMTGDTQEIEGMNNVAKAIVRAGPRSALSLVSARMVHRKLLGLGKKTAVRRWGSVSDRFEELKEAAVESFPDMREVLDRKKTVFRLFRLCRFLVQQHPVTHRTRRRNSSLFGGIGLAAREPP